MWDEVKNLLGKSAPMIGTLIGGPAGAGIGALVANTLGVENEPESIAAELKNNPEALLKVKEIESNETIRLKELAFKHAELESEEKKTQIIQQGKTMRAEYSSDDAYVRRWRPTYGYVVCFSWLALFLAISISIVAEPAKASLVITSVTSLSPLFMMALGVLGVNIHKRSNDKMVDAGVLPGGAIGGIKNLISGIKN